MSVTVTQLRKALEELEREGHGELELECTESQWTGMYPERCAVVRENGELHVELCEILEGADVIVEVLIEKAPR